MWGSPEPSWRGLAPSIVPVWPTYAAAQTDEAVQLSQSRLGVGSRDRKKGGGRRGLEGGLFICVALVNTPMCNERSHCVEGLWNKVACRVKDKLSLKIYVNNPKTVRKTQKDEKCQSWRNTFSWSDFLSINHLTDILSFANRSFRRGLKSEICPPSEKPICYTTFLRQQAFEQVLPPRDLQVLLRVWGDWQWAERNPVQRWYENTLLGTQE